MKRKFQVRSGQALGISRHAEMELAKGSKHEQAMFAHALNEYRQAKPKRRRYASLQGKSVNTARRAREARAAAENAARPRPTVFTMQPNGSYAESDAAAMMHKIAADRETFIQCSAGKVSPKKIAGVLGQFRTERMQLQRLVVAAME